MRGLMEGVQQEQEQKAKLVKKGKGSFRITREACEILIDNIARGWQIGAYLVLAKHTDVSGKFTTAGHRAIYEATGASPGTERNPGAARRLVKELMEMEGNKVVKAGAPEKLIYTANEWHDTTGELIPEIPHKLYPVTFVLNDFGSDDWIWFPNELVDGHGRFKQPLRRLKQIGDVAARLLLIAYSANDMEQFGGIPPLFNFYREYVSYDHMVTSNGYTFHVATRKNNIFHNNITLNAFRKNQFADEIVLSPEQICTVANALLSLQNQGFVYEIITVMDGPPDEIDSRPIYELHNRDYSANKGEEGLVKRIDRVFAKAMKLSDVEYFSADKQGRYHERYPVISRVGGLPNVVGIYRLRFRLSNPKNYPVRAGWKRIDKDRTEWETILEDLEKKFGIVRKVPPKKPAAPSSTPLSPKLWDPEDEVPF